MLLYPASTQPAKQKSSGTAENEQHLIPNICSSTLLLLLQVELKIILNILRIWKTTFVEDNICRRRPQWKMSVKPKNSWKLAKLAFVSQVVIFCFGDVQTFLVCLKFWLLSNVYGGMVGTGFGLWVCTRHLKICCTEATFLLRHPLYILFLLDILFSHFLYGRCKQT